MSNIDTPVAHVDAANALVTQIRTLIQSVSGYTHISRGQHRRLVPPAAVPDRFLLTVATALDASSVLANVAQVTGADLRDAINFANAFATLVTELEVLQRGLRETITARRAEAGSGALRAYRMSKSLVGPPEKAVLIPYINDMKIALGRSGIRPAPEAPPATVLPDPAIAA